MAGNGYKFNTPAESLPSFGWGRESRKSKKSLDSCFRRNDVEENSVFIWAYGFLEIYYFPFFLELMGQCPLLLESRLQTNRKIYPRRSFDS